MKDRPKVVISVSAETESHAESRIRLLVETEITPKVSIHFRPKTKTETENACDLSLYRRLQLSPSYETIRSHSIRSALLGSLSTFLKYSHIQASSTPYTEV